MQAFLDVVVEFVGAKTIAAEKALERGRWGKIAIQTKFGIGRFLDRRQHRFELRNKRRESRNRSKRFVQFFEKALCVSLLYDTAVFLLPAGHGLAPIPPRVPGKKFL